MTVRLKDLSARIVSTEIYKYPQISDLPAYLTDRILSEYVQDGRSIDLPLLKLMTGEKWRLSSLTIQRQTVDVTFMKLIEALGNQLHSLQFQSCKLETSCDLKRISSSLEVLVLEGCTGFSAKHLEQIGDGSFSRLKRLELKQLGEIKGKLKPILLPCLATLTLSQVKFNILPLLRDLSGSLRVLRLDRVSEVSKQLQATATILPNLTELHLSDQDIGARLIATLRSWFPSLRNVCITRSKARVVDSFWIDDDDQKSNPLLEMALDELRKSGITVIYPVSL